MNTARKIHLSVVALLWVSLACASLPAISTPDTGAISTAAAQTVIAGLTQKVEQMTPSATSTATVTSEPPTVTPTETVTPSQTVTSTQTPTATLAFTPSPSVPLISVSTPTNCRSGPGKVYDMKGALLVGEFAEVYGRDASNNYWYIRNPDPGAKFCWVWGEFATLTGPVLLLPVFTPPPTPTPVPTFTATPFAAFYPRYAGLDTCKDKWWIEIRLKNTGTLPLKSMSISVRDKVTGLVVTSFADGFTNKDGCLVRSTKDILGLGSSYVLSGPAVSYNPTKHGLKVTLTLCSSKGQKGICTTRKLDVKP
jgi:hypothetical protein